MWNTKVDCSGYELHLGEKKLIRHLRGGVVLGQARCEFVGFGQIFNFRANMYLGIPGTYLYQFLD